MNQFYSTFQKNNPNQFNPELMKIREKDYVEIPKIIEGILKSMETIEGVRITGCDLECNELEMPNKVIDGTKTISIYDERKNSINIKFEITAEDKTEEVKKTIYIPKLLDGNYFMLNGNRFFPILQLVDTNIYKVVSGTKGQNKFTLKTMIMPMSFKQYKNKITDTSKQEYHFNFYELNLFKASINFCYYYLAKFGYEGTIKELGLEGILVQESDINEIPNYHSFRINKKVIVRVPELLFFDVRKLDIICSFISVFSSRITLDKILDHNYWIKKLGGFFTTNQNTREKKALNVISSLERILLENSKNKLQLDDEIVENTYKLINYIIDEGENINKLDIMDLANKRIRFAEYLTYSLAIHSSDFTYRLLNRVSKITMSAKKQSTSIKPNILLDDARTHDLIRYDNAVNGLALFQSILKITIKGPQGINGDMSATNRDLHPSFIGKTSLVFSSPSSVGETNLLTPFCKIYDNLYFYPKNKNDKTS